MKNSKKSFFSLGFSLLCALAFLANSQGVISFDAKPSITHQAQAYRPSAVATPPQLPTLSSKPAPALPHSLGKISISDKQALEIGRRIWKNECGGTIEGLTSWNAGEAFPSLGICHFIWFPKGVKTPFKESFPQFVAYAKKSGVKMPKWCDGPCPWKSRTEFLAAVNGKELTELRKILVGTVHLQARFAVNRLEASLPLMLDVASPGKSKHIQYNFYRVAREPNGYYPLVDYVNFKGEGLRSGDDYGGKGWGLRQVLEAMPTTGSALPAFAKAADEVLTRRVQNSPGGKDARWLLGWRNRLATYTR